MSKPEIILTSTEKNAFFYRNRKTFEEMDYGCDIDEDAHGNKTLIAFYSPSTTSCVICHDFQTNT
ncbi:MAG: hypothetical protein ACE5KZ_13240 [Candidatus Scalinduaceae bacterium]